MSADAIQRDLAKLRERAKHAGHNKEDGDFSRARSNQTRRRQFVMKTQGRTKKLRQAIAAVAEPDAITIDDDLAKAFKPSNGL